MMTSLLNGGVIVVSKWPIIHEAQHVYRNACHYSDCLAAKGVKYARMLKTVGSTSKIFNVFATHMQVRTALNDRPSSASVRLLKGLTLNDFPINLCRRGQLLRAEQIEWSKQSRYVASSLSLQSEQHS